MITKYDMMFMNEYELNLKREEYKRAFEFAEDWLEHEANNSKPKLVEVQKRVKQEMEETIDFIDELIESKINYNI